MKKLDLENAFAQSHIGCAVCDGCIAPVIRTARVAGGYDEE